MTLIRSYYDKARSGNLGIKPKPVPTLRSCLLSFLLVAVQFSLRAQLAVGEISPNFEFPEVHGEHLPPGNSLGDYRGEVVVLDFWAIWCTPCVAAIPKLNQLYREFEDRDVRFLAITDDPQVKLENFLSKTSFRFPIVRDGDKSIFQAYRVLGRPQYYVVNRSGRVVYAGSAVNAELLEEVLATDAVAVKPPAPPEPSGYESEVITYGHYQPGEDPTYIGVLEMLERDRHAEDRFVSQFILRPSLPGMGNLLGNRFDSKRNRVGVTYPNAPLPVLLAYVKQLTSARWITNETGDNSDYDLIYSRSAPSLESAFAEIEAGLLRDLNLRLDEAPVTEEVGVIVARGKAHSAITKDQIPEGAERTYVDIKSLIAAYEEITDGKMVADDGLTELYVYDKDLVYRSNYQPSVEQLQAILLQNDLYITRQQREIVLYRLERIPDGKSR